jgi:hypothetical protein
MPTAKAASQRIDCALVWRMRTACKQYPLNAALLKAQANMVIKTIVSLGLEAELPTRWEQTGAYKKAARTYHVITGKRWISEKIGTGDPGNPPIPAGVMQE